MRLGFIFKEQKKIFFFFTGQDFHLKQKKKDCFERLRSKS